ncbi:MAG: M23 family metallopeptidase [Lachnospiraceae bacterium]|nr:M23 family metallopeptidase [Lachnospiraceae bacterium]
MSKKHFIIIPKEARCASRKSHYKLENLFFIALFLGLAAYGLYYYQNGNTLPSLSDSSLYATTDTAKEYIKWVDFNASCEDLQKAYTYDVESYEQEIHYNWIDLLSYAACKNGNDFSKTSVTSQAMEDFTAALTQGQSVEELTNDMKYFSYYQQCFSAILSGMVGEYELENEQGKMEKHYGLKAFLPIAKNFPYSDYDDFGVSRSYGYARPHLGHDMMGQVGTPIVAVESGYVEVLGWNQYGGWRIGIRSFDKKRYYYYAHLRKDFPYCKTLKEGDLVTAGDVIGYMGRTGYSAKENVNNIDEYHLHFGLQLIFDESQKDGNNEIWVSCYQLVRFLYQNRSETVKNTQTKEWVRIRRMKDPAVEDYAKTLKKK